MSDSSERVLLDMIADRLSGLHRSIEAVQREVQASHRDGQARGLEATVGLERVRGSIEETKARLENLGAQVREAQAAIQELRKDREAAEKVMNARIGEFEADKRLLMRLLGIVGTLASFLGVDRLLSVLANRP